MPRTTRGKKQQGLPVAAKTQGTCTVCRTTYKRGDKVIYLHGRTAAHPECVYQPA